LFFPLPVFFLSDSGCLARGSFLFAADGIARSSELNNKKIADGCLPAKSLMRAVNFFGTLHGARQNRQFYLRPGSLYRSFHRRRVYINAVGERPLSSNARRRSQPKAPIVGAPNTALGLFRAKK
jgi:hypothetical protein